MMKRIVPGLALLLMVVGCATKPIIREESAPVVIESEMPDPVPESAPSVIRAQQVSPSALARTIRLDHGVIKIDFDEALNLPRLVTYELTAQNLRARFIKREKSEKFRPDPILGKGRSLVTSDYNGSKYDRGHMAPAEDMSWDKKAYLSSFYMTNMAPQMGNLNQRAWSSLEERVRMFACGEEKITVFTGPVMGKSTKSFKKSKRRVSVPEQFFKVVVDETSPRKAIGFLYSQSDSESGILPQRIVPVSSIQDVSGVPFSEMVREPKALKLSKSGNLKDWKTGNEGRDCPQQKKQISSRELGE